MLLPLPPPLLLMQLPDSPSVPFGLSLYGLEGLELLWDKGVDIKASIAWRRGAGARGADGSGSLDDSTKGSSQGAPTANGNSGSSGGSGGAAGRGSVVLVAFRWAGGSVWVKGDRPGVPAAMRCRAVDERKDALHALDFHAPPCAGGPHHLRTSRPTSRRVAWGEQSREEREAARTRLRGGVIPN